MVENSSKLTFLKPASLKALVIILLETISKETIVKLFT